KPVALRLAFDFRIPERAHELDHAASFFGKRIGLVSIGSPAELRLEIAAHCPICGETPPPTTISISDASTGETTIARSVGARASLSAKGVDSPCLPSFCQSYEYLNARSAIPALSF